MAVGGIIYNFLKFFSLSLFHLKPVWIEPAFLLKDSYLYIVKHDNMVQKATLLHKNISHRNLNNSTLSFCFHILLF